MPTKIYLGKPPQHVIDWIKSHSQPATHEETWYKYAGDTEWRTINISEDYIEGNIAFSQPTEQIPNIKNVTELEIGSNIKRISLYAFFDCDNLTNIIIPNSVTTIEANSFTYCANLTNIIIISSNLTWLEIAFDGCDNLTDITFEGKDRATIQAMENYPFGLDYANANGVTIHCTDGDIQVSHV